MAGQGVATRTAWQPRWQWWPDFEQLYWLAQCTAAGFLVLALAGCAVCIGIELLAPAAKSRKLQQPAPHTEPDLLCELRRWAEGWPDSMPDELAHAHLEQDLRAAAWLLSEYALLEDMPHAVRADSAAVLASVQTDGCMLEYASAELQNDYSIVVAAVRQNGLALEFASEQLRNNHALVLIAVEQRGWALEFASAKLRSHHMIVLAAVQRNGCALEYASEDLRHNRVIVQAAIPIRTKHAL